VQVDAEQDERPEEDGEDGRQDAAPTVDVLEVVMTGAMATPTPT
jgi:hypothetical protein